MVVCFFFQAEDGIRDLYVTGVQTCAPPIWPPKYCFSVSNCRRNRNGSRESRRSSERESKTARLGRSSSTRFRIDLRVARSEERRVGKECRSGGSRDEEKKKERDSQSTSE